MKEEIRLGSRSHVRRRAAAAAARASIIYPPTSLMLLVLGLLTPAGLPSVRPPHSTPHNLPPSTADMPSTQHGKHALIAEQCKLHDEFQAALRMLQRPSSCKCVRAYNYDDHVMDGFALQVQALGRDLGRALASGRALVFDPKWSFPYVPETCDGGWACLFEPISTCTLQTATRESKSACAHAYHQWRVHAHEQGIDFSRTHSGFFDVALHGPARVVNATEVNGGMHAVVGSWERRLGKFWVRSQLAHYLWRLASPFAQALADVDVIQAVRKLENSSQPYIGFHIRYTDNVASLWKDFGRNATVTRDFDRFMAHANSVRRQDRRLRHIFISTDSSEMIRASQASQWAAQGWSFLVQQDVPRRTLDKSGMMWYRDLRSSEALHVAADIEGLRRADYLVGSFQSNVYRLATQLNAAYHRAKYPTSVERMYAIEPEIEWYEDP